jgi:hypothetical protein
MQVLILSCQSRSDTVDRPWYHEQPHHRKNKDREQRAHFLRSRHVSTQNPKDTKTKKKNKLPDPENWMTPTPKKENQNPTQKKSKQKLKESSKKA